MTTDEKIERTVSGVITALVFAGLTLLALAAIFPDASIAALPMSIPAIALSLFMGVGGFIFGWICAPVFWFIANLFT